MNQCSIELAKKLIFESLKLDLKFKMNKLYLIRN